MFPQIQMSSSWGPKGDIETILFMIVCFLLVILTSAALHGWMIYREYNAIRHPACRRHRKEARLEYGLSDMKELGEDKPLLLPRGSSNDGSPCRPPSMSQVREIAHDAHQDEDDEVDSASGENDNDSLGDYCLDGSNSNVGASLDNETYIYMRDIFGPKRTPPTPLPDYIKSLPRKC
ncbi:hypothetical protein PG985_004443 [Apiospora marii]|uniref:Uncharacterized protein n=1 Tax=Apiospora marii TaxID=335849 RepID=A0ABR1SAK3_9PEZI